MKKIKLTQNKYALVDDADFAMLNQYKWYAHKDKNTFYAIRNGKMKNGKREKTIFMHREILKPKDTFEIDHRDMNGLNNQQKNLRECTSTENKRNRKIMKTNNSGFKGVSFHKQTKKWQANITFGNKQITLGRFLNKIEAYKAYVGACKKYHNKFARLK